MTSGVSVAEFKKNIMLCRATERCLEIIGESARRISDNCRNTHDEVPWRDIIGQRNIIAHEYGQIDYELLYKTAIDDIPVLNVLSPDDTQGSVNAASARSARLHGKDCSIQSFCISSIHGGQMQEVRLHGCNR